ncbi:MAG: hypothetical protein IJO79_03395 [Firmicutes bacterium]|nr:hypothetical protein [Bacillota bacterium]
MNEKIQTTAAELAADIMTLARDQMMGSLRYLNRAFFRMPMVPHEGEEIFASNGLRVYYNVPRLLRRVQLEPNYCSRALLHMILHWIFQHPFKYKDMERPIWDLAADLAVEKAIVDLSIRGASLEGDPERISFFNSLKARVPVLTAERIYRYLLDNPSEFTRLSESARLFFRDHHNFWIPEEDAKKSKDGKPNDPMATGSLGCDNNEEDQKGDDLEGHESMAGQAQNQWEEIGRQTETNLETFYADEGMGSGTILMNLKGAFRKRQDYGEFLKKFMVIGEEIQINQDEFDYLYYMYGLDLYGDMPLIEPLEYRESNRVKEFVIAIDTSGSCKGRTVEQFLHKTYAILKSSETFFEKVNVHIIQCDAAIQKDVKITTQDEFDRYMEDMELAGFGGTDFRPVFEYVDKLIALGEFQNLRGLIYFTDGRGTFPEKMPEYKTAFVYMDNAFSVSAAPAWAIQLVLQEEELE